ncbi:hypothetical protein ES708_12121 [subsurface metagenome]
MEIRKDTICTFIKKNGEQCQAHKLRGSSYCYWHSDQVVVARADARRRGGLARHAGGELGSYTIKSPQDILGLLEDAINSACALSNSLGRAKTIGYLAQIILRGFEVTELSTRLKALEDRVYKKK